MKHLLLSVLFGLVAGCTCVDVCSEGKNMVVVRNSGLFLFSKIPICSGDPDYPNQEVCNWFSNTVTLDTNIRLLNEEIERQGARGVRNLASHRNDETVVFLLLKHKTYKTSAELIRP